MSRITIMNKMTILVRREFWEHRNTFLILPAVIAGFILILMLLGLFYESESMSFNLEADINGTPRLLSLNADNGGNWAHIAIRELLATPAEMRTTYLELGFQGITGLLSFILCMVIITYLLNTLYKDRSDRSILFWKSLPVSDTLTVMAKLLTAITIVPLCYFCAAAALQFAWMILLSFVAMDLDISAWDAVWAQAPFANHWFHNIVLLGFNGVWTLPLVGWLLAVSAFAKGTPLVSAMGAPLGLIVVEAMLTDHGHLGDWIASHSIPITNYETVSMNIISSELLSALLVGSFFIGTAIFFRSRAEDF